ncbi:MAG TPA: molybdenum cofactor biosynthesis protein MoaE [Xanthomonadaceae bacterium]|nr:molybdenum cofactor biosynthesis protein MoaE [Xanthomonadaceae bacterium]
MNPRCAIVDEAIDADALRRLVGGDAAGAYVAFEGRVRDHHQGRSVTGLDYQAHRTLAERELATILAELHERFAIVDAACQHRVGALGVGEVAVVCAVAAAHREAAFAACRHLIDEVKRRVPIWKREHYPDAGARWIHD